MSYSNGCTNIYWLKKEVPGGEGGKITGVVEACPVRFIPNFRHRCTYIGCAHYIPQRRRFCRAALGPRRDLFPDDSPAKIHNGKCSLVGREFYKFTLEMQDHSGSIQATISEAAEHLLGDGAPLPAREWAQMTKEDHKDLIWKKFTRLFFFHLVYKNLSAGNGEWSVVGVSAMLPQPPRSPSPSPLQSEASGISSTYGSSVVGGGEGLPDGSPMRRLLNIDRRLLFTQPPTEEFRGRTSRQPFISALEGLQQSSVALHKASKMVDTVIDALASFLQSDATVSEGKSDI